MSKEAAGAFLTVSGRGGASPGLTDFILAGSGGEGQAVAGPPRQPAPAAGRGSARWPQKGSADLQSAPTALAIRVYSRKFAVKPPALIFIYHFSPPMDANPSSWNAVQPERTTSPRSARRIILRQASTMRGRPPLNWTCSVVPHPLAVGPPSFLIHQFTCRDGGSKV